MRAVVQRVKSAAVKVGDKTTGAIEKGILLFLGIGPNDTDTDLNYLIDKTTHLRIFEDSAGKMNLSLIDVGGSLLVVSQFTLYGDCRKGRRPSFTASAPPEMGEQFYDKFIDKVRAMGIPTETGRFGAMMDVELINDGPVTFLLDSTKAF